MGMVVALKPQVQESAFPHGMGFEWMRIIKTYAFLLYHGLIDDDLINRIVLGAMKECKIDMIVDRDGIYHMRAKGKDINDLTQAKQLVRLVADKFEFVRSTLK